MEGGMDLYLMDVVPMAVETLVGMDLDLMVVVPMAVETLPGTVRDWDLGSGGLGQGSPEIGSKTGTEGDTKDDFERQWLANNAFLTL